MTDRTEYTIRIRRMRLGDRPKMSLIYTFEPFPNEASCLAALHDLGAPLVASCQFVAVRTEWRDNKWSHTIIAESPFGSMIPADYMPRPAR